MMEIAASTISIADICIRYGNILVRTCKSYKNADQEIRESVLMIEARWFKIQQQLELLREIWSSLDDEYQLHQNSILHVLHGKTQSAVSLVDSIIGKSNEESSIWNIMSKKGDAKRLKYAVWVKQSLENVSKELKEWSEVFDVSWFLIARISSSSLDQQLRSVATNEAKSISELKGLREAMNSTLTSESEADKKTVFLHDNFFAHKCYTPIQLGSTASGVWEDSGQQIKFLVDQPTTISTLADVCKLAKILRNIDSFQFGILACRGVVKSTFEAEQGFSTRLLFNIPLNLTNPQHLRTILSCSNTSYPLDDRFLLARQLAKGVMFVHSAGFVHKNIRPDTILVFQDEKSNNLWPVLTGFERFRLAEGNTLYQGDDAWELNLYRHPKRQGMNPEVTYSMQHDIYSLGVCLLEIGLGESFVAWDARELENLPSSSISEAISSPIKDKRKKAFETKRYLVSLAENRLPSRMGRQFTNVVVTCLACLDPSDNTFGDESEFLDENGILVGVRFIEKVLSVLLNLKI